MFIYGWYILILICALVFGIKSQKQGSHIHLKIRKPKIFYLFIGWLFSGILHPIIFLEIIVELKNDVNIGWDTITSFAGICGAGTTLAIGFGLRDNRLITEKLIHNYIYAAMIVIAALIVFYTAGLLFSNNLDIITLLLSVFVGPLYGSLIAFFFVPISIFVTRFIIYKACIYSLEDSQPLEDGHPLKDGNP